MSVVNDMCSTESFKPTGTTKLGCASPLHSRIRDRTDYTHISDGVLEQQSSTYRIGKHRSGVVQIHLPS